MAELNDKERPVPTKIWVQAKRTINTGNYESAAFDAGIEVSVPPGADLDKIYSHAYDVCQREVIKAAIKAGVIGD